MMYFQHLTAIFLALATLLSLTPSRALAGMPVEARIIDGKTFELSGKTYVLRGIDAPDLDQTCTSRKGNNKPCGRLSAQALYFLLRHSKIVCKDETPLPDGKIEATCQVGWVNVSDQMVLDGWAFARPDASGDAYRKHQTAAKARHEGLWRGTFDMPWDWRAKKKGGNGPKE